MHVDDFAVLAVAQGTERVNRVIDAIGPETFTYRQLVEEIAGIIGVRRLIVSVPPAIGYFVGAVLGKMVGDVMITRDEVDGLMADLLVTSSPPAGTTRLTDWARQHANTLGRHYASELARRKNRQKAYETL
jgi:NADH dehydrogenase